MPSRDTVVRWFCALALISWALSLALWFYCLINLWLIRGGMSEGSLASAEFVVLFCAMALHLLSGSVLHLAFKCRQCRYPLYQFWSATWLTGTVARANEAPKEPHEAAENLAGFYGLGGAWAKVRTGVAHCAWCGYADGEKRT